MTRFVAVDLKLAGGSTPSADGLRWLVEKGYRTILDLRESSEVSPSFIAEVTGLGLRYVALPLSLKTIDRAHFDRFNFEVASGDARPLFFFDSDGTRAGTLWYIRRIANDRVDHQIARREAEELGLIDKGYWAAATSFVSKLSAPRTSATSRDIRLTSTSTSSSTIGADSAVTQAAMNIDSAEAPGAVPNASIQSPPARSAEPPNPAVALAGASNQPLPQPASTISPPIPSDPLAWRPFAAMALTGLTLPLAFWGRTLAPAILAKALASLPAPAHRPRSLPGELGA
jgi:protein tyrosine phosphatase (PTP) superfamily phosphohydrolase (DUF442 family)